MRSLSPKIIMSSKNLGFLFDMMKQSSSIYLTKNDLLSGLGVQSSQEIFLLS